MARKRMKRCPCCGGKPEFYKDAYAFKGQIYCDRYPEPVASQDHGFWIRCTQCGLQTCYWHYENEAVESWNKRAV